MAYTNIDDPSAYFQTALYTGSNNQSITNDGNSDLQPDFVWIKRRSDADHHSLTNSSLGVNKQLLSSSSNGEQSRTDQIQSFNTDGFTLGTDGAGYTNVPGNTYVAWQWKANGGTTSSNTDGSINTTVQSNSTAGFNIITYTGTGGSETLGHNLGVAPDMWIIKRRSGTGSWAVGFNDSSILGGTSNYLILQSTGATSTYNNFWGSSPANSNVMRIAGDSTIGGSGSTYVAYAFAEKQGYSKFGKYVGNSNDNGTFVYLGFKPRWLMIKSTQAGMSWDIIDTARSTSNVMDDYLTANTTDPEGTSSTKNIDFLSNGFKCRDDNNINFSDHTYIYMAFAENPFTTSTGIPTTAR